MNARSLKSTALSKKSRPPQLIELMFELYMPKPPSALRRWCCLRQVVFLGGPDSLGYSIEFLTGQAEVIQSLGVLPLGFVQSGL